MSTFIHIEQNMLLFNPTVYQKIIIFHPIIRDIGYHPWVKEMLPLYNYFLIIYSYTVQANFVHLSDNFPIFFLHPIAKEFLLFVLDSEACISIQNVQGTRKIVTLFNQWFQGTRKIVILLNLWFQGTRKITILLNLWFHGTRKITILLNLWFQGTRKITILLNLQYDFREPGKL